MFHSHRSSSRSGDPLSAQLMFAILALCWVLLNAACGRTSSNAPPAPLTPQQKQDLMSALEGVSAVQAAVPEFGFQNHPASTKPGLRRMEDLIRMNCTTDVERTNNNRDLEYLKLSGARCPVTLVYDLSVERLGNSETRSMTWNYEVIDDSARSYNSIDRIALTGSQHVITSVTASGVGGTIDFKISGPIRSPQLGDGSLELVNTGRFSYAQGATWSESTTIAHVRFPTFDAEFKAVETMSEGRSIRRYSLNGTALSESELNELKARLPILLNPGSNKL